MRQRTRLVFELNLDNENTIGWLSRYDKFIGLRISDLTLLIRIDDLDREIDTLTRIDGKLYIPIPQKGLKIEPFKRRIFLKKYWVSQRYVMKLQREDKFKIIRVKIPTKTNEITAVLLRMRFLQELIYAAEMFRTDDWTE